MKCVGVTVNVQTMVPFRDGDRERLKMLQFWEADRKSIKIQLEIGSAELLTTQVIQWPASVCFGGVFSKLNPVFMRLHF